MYHTPRSRTEIRSRNRRLRTKETEPHPAGYGPDMIMQRGYRHSNAPRQEGRAGIAANLDERLRTALFERHRERLAVTRLFEEIDVQPQRALLREASIGSTSSIISM